MFEIPSHGGLPHRLFEKLNEGNVGEAHALLASPLRAIITVSQLAAHIDGMLWPGKRIRDAKGLRQMSFGGFGCIDGRLAIRDDIDLTYESAAAVTVVVHSVQENGDWRIATIERVSSAAGAAEPATGERP